MADITITAANVIAASNAKIRHGIAGATITAGQVVFLDQTTSGRYELADSDEDTAAERGAEGLAIALNGASDGQPLAVALPGSDITIGATLTAGTTYYLSATAGGIGVIGDITGGPYYVIIGIAKSASVLHFDPQYSGVASS